MSKVHPLSRREFLKFVGMGASAVALQACTPGISTSSAPSTTTGGIQPTTEAKIPTQLPPSPTPKPVVEVIFPEMVLVEQGIFEMGSDDFYAHEGPVHTVELTRSFSMGVYAVTYDEYDRYCDDSAKMYVDDRGRGRGAQPISGVDWYDVVAYCNWLSEEAGLAQCYSGGGKVTKCDFTLDGYRLPTEAEWEYAARGGLKSQGYLYAGSNDPDEVGWHADNSGGVSHPVGEKKPNELGLYDMSGNRWEWCWDWYGEDYYSISPEVDPTGPDSIPKGAFVERSRRSSSAVEAAASLRVTYRSADGVSYPGDDGFRLVRTVSSDNSCLSGKLLR